MKDFYYALQCLAANQLLSPNLKAILKRKGDKVSTEAKDAGTLYLLSQILQMQIPSWEWVMLHNKNELYSACNYAIKVRKNRWPKLDAEIQSRCRNYLFHIPYEVCEYADKYLHLTCYTDLLRWIENGETDA